MNLKNVRFQNNLYNGYTVQQVLDALVTNFGMETVLHSLAEIAKEQAVAPDRATCPDCEADIPNDGNCWYCENMPTRPMKKPINWKGHGVGDKVVNIQNKKRGEIIRLNWARSALVEYDDGTREDDVLLSNLNVIEYAN